MLFTPGASRRRKGTSCTNATRDLCPRQEAHGIHGVAAGKPALGAVLRPGVPLLRIGGCVSPATPCLNSISAWTRCQGGAVQRASMRSVAEGGASGMSSGNCPGRIEARRPVRGTRCGIRGVLRFVGPRTGWWCDDFGRYGVEGTLIPNPAPRSSVSIFLVPATLVPTTPQQRPMRSGSCVRSVLPGHDSVRSAESCAPFRPVCPARAPLLAPRTVICRVAKAHLVQGRRAPRHA